MDKKLFASSPQDQMVSRKSCDVSLSTDDLSDLARIASKQGGENDSCIDYSDIPSFTEEHGLRFRPARDFEQFRRWQDRHHPEQVAAFEEARRRWHVKHDRPEKILMIVPIRAGWIGRVAVFWHNLRMGTAVHITLEEFLARPDREDDQREELIEGEVIVSPGAKADHSEIVELLRKQLAGLERQDYVLRNDFSCVLGGRSMPIPDLAAVRRERWTKAVKAREWVSGSPELVIEVSSPSNRKLLNKAGLYLDYGAEQVWVIYPKRQTVTVVTTEGTSEARVGEVLNFHGVRVLVDSIFPFC